MHYFLKFSVEVAEKLFEGREDCHGDNRLPGRECTSDLQQATAKIQAREPDGWRGSADAFRESDYLRRGQAAAVDGSSQVSGARTCSKQQ